MGIDMSEIGACEAKTHLSEILERVCNGECVAIAKHGQAVAKLRPPLGQGLEQRRAAVVRMRAFQARHGLGCSLRESIDAGPRY